MLYSRDISDTFGKVILPYPGRKWFVETHSVHTMYVEPLLCYPHTTVVWTAHVACSDEGLDESVTTVRWLVYSTNNNY